MGGRPTKAAHSDQWVRSAVQQLDGDKRLKIVDTNPDVTLNIELAKAYLQTMATQKSATVVLSVRYGEGEPKIFRGSYDGVNWVNGEAEAQSALDFALSEAIEALNSDLVRYCSSQVAKGPA